MLTSEAAEQQRATMPIDYSKFDKIGEDPPLPEMPEAQKQAM